MFQNVSALFAADIITVLLQLPLQFEFVAYTGTSIQQQAGLFILLILLSVIALCPTFLLPLFHYFPVLLLLI
jgi:hypothetical protein